MSLTSIVLTCLNNSRFNAHMSMASIAAITKFTDPEDYELIVVDPESKYPIRDDYHVLKIDKWLKPSPDPGYTACMNLGAKKAKGEYIVFMQNDVFVHEGWLSNLRLYLESGLYDVVWPDQVPRDREYVLASYKRNHFDTEAMKGSRDAGLFMITKKGFEKTGGWDEDLGLLAEKDFYLNKVNGAGLRWTDTNKVIITHIMAGTNLQLLDSNPEEYDRRMDKDAKKTN